MFLRLPFLFLGLIFVLSETSLADPAKDCALIEQDLDRLACYDALFRASETATEQPAGGAWQVDTETSKFDDKTNVYMHVTSLEDVRCGYSGAQPIRLYLRCVENTTALILATHCHVASGFSGYGQVEYRIDDQSTRKRGFNESTNNRSLGLWNGGQSIPLIKQLFGADRLLVRFTPFNENPVTAEFPISGLDEAIAPLRKECNW